MNKDVLLELIVRSDVETLELLSQVPLWDDIVPLIGNVFWKKRTEFVLNRSLEEEDRNLDWKKIYYIVYGLTNEGQEKFDWRNFNRDRISKAREASLAVLGYLPALLLLIKLYGEPKWREDVITQQAIVWPRISSKEVLHFLLEQKYVTVEIAQVVDAIEEAVPRGDIEMIHYLLNLVEPSHWNTGELSDALEEAIDRGQLDITQLLVEWGAEVTDEDMKVAARDSTEEVMSYLLRREERHVDILYNLGQYIGYTVKDDNAATLKAILDYADEYNYPVWTVTKLRFKYLWKKIVMKQKINVATLMVEREVVEFSEEEWTKLLQQAVDHNLDLIAALALENLPVKLPGKSDDLIGQLRAGGGVIANNIIYQKVVSSPALTVLNDVGRDSERDTELAWKLTKSSDVTKWNKETVRVFAWCLNLVRGDRVNGFEEGRREVVHYRLLGSYIDSSLVEGTDNYSTLLRLMFFEQAKNGLELIRWMIQQRDRELILAARSLFVDDLEMSSIRIDKAFTPIRALLISIAYPTMSRSEAIEYLMEEGVNGLSLELSAQLIGAHIGDKNQPRRRVHRDERKFFQR